MAMPAPPDPESIAERVAAASTRLVSRQWYAEARKIEEQVDDPSARWDILTTALRRVGWPGERPARSR